MIESKYITVPLLRGFDQIRDIFDLIGNRGYICGGYARYCASERQTNNEAEDVDIFPTTNESSASILKDFQDREFEIAHENHVSISLKLTEDEEKLKEVRLRWKMAPKIQIIKPVVEGRILTIGSKEDILNNFDFTVVRALIVNPYHILVDEDFVEDEKHKLIRIKNIHCPISSTLRCMKYARKGYFMKPSQALALFKDWDERGEDYKKRMIELFEERSPSGEMTQTEIDELESLLRID